jgi:protein-tyrosine kinase
MSKIEDALKRARSSRGESLQTQDLHRQPRHPVAGRPASPAQSRELVGLTAAEEIATMREARRRDAAFLSRQRIIDKDMEDPRVSDSFRQIRTALLQKSAGKNFVLMVTSVAPEGGASFVSMNLAASFAFDESKTALLIDCNLRQPRFSELVIGEQEALGLTDYLSGAETQIESIIHPVGIPRLRVIPVGSKNRTGTEYFTAPQLMGLLREVCRRYRERFIVIDAPPIMEAADARILAELCDYTLLVVPYGKVTSAQVAAAAELVGHEKLAGCVMNNETRPPLWRRRQAAVE